MTRDLHITHREQPTTLFESVGSRTKRATISTDDPVEVYDRTSGRVIREVLRMDGVTMPATVPLLVDHERSSRSTIGTAKAFTFDGGRLDADLVFASGTTLADETWQLASQGHLRAVSVGYRVVEYTDVPAGRAKTIGGTTYTGPVRVVTRWSLYEVSVVPIGADPSAKMRSRSLPPVKDNKAMTTAVQPDRDTRHLRLVDYARAHVAGRNQQVPDNDSDMLRTWASVGGLDDLAGVLGGWLLDGYNAAADSTAGWVSEVPLPNYLEHRLATITTPAAPLRLARGDTAAPVVMASQYETWRLFRTAIAFEISEEDMIDSADSLDVMALAMREVGAGFRRVVLDAVWGLILSNPQLADGDDLFSVARGNLGTAVVGNVGLGAAWGAIGGTVRQISEGPATYAHENITPSYLVVAPEKTVFTLEAIAASTQSLLPLRVRSESRLSDNAFLDPRDDTVRSGNGTNWLVAASAAQAPSIVLGLLNGRREPRVRRYELGHGQWGIGLSAELSLGVTAVSGAPLYFSTGLG